MARLRVIYCSVALLAALGGCRNTRQVRDPEYARVASAVCYSQTHPAAFEAAVVAPTAELEGPQPVERLIQIALAQNPEVQAARKRMESAAYQVPVAASLPDPMLGVTAYPAPVQTAAGQQDLALTVSQKFVGRKKLDASAGVAASRTEMERARLAAAELAAVDQVKQSYYELYYVEQALQITQAEQDELAKIRDIANARYRANLTSQQDVLRAELEVSSIENELIRLRQQIDSTQAKLARVLHVSPRTRLQTLGTLESERAPANLDELERQAVAARPELHAQLAALERDRRTAQRMRLDYIPDVTLGATWIDTSESGISPVANGRDALLLNASINLPIYRKRLESSVRSAESASVATARDYDALRDATLEQVADLFAKARSQQDLILLFQEDILPKARQTLEVSSRAYSVGEVDFLQLIDNFRLLLRYEVSYRRLEASLRQTIASLERLVGGPLPPSAEVVSPPEPAPRAAGEEEDDDGALSRLPSPPDA